MLIEEGETEAAAEAYGQFQKSTYATSDQGRINSASYLEMAGRYAEAADIYMDIDRIMKCLEADDGSEILYRDAQRIQEIFNSLSSLSDDVYIRALSAEVE